MLGEWGIGRERREVRHEVPGSVFSERRSSMRHYVCGGLILRHGYGGTVADSGARLSWWMLGAV